MAEPNTLFRPGVDVPGQPANQLAPQPTWADAADYNAPLVQQHFADQWADWQRPEYWQQQAGNYVNALVAGTTAPGFRAFHGSPHSFDKFDASAIGTGEGAQAYGHGLYFAENEAVARDYRNRLAPGGEPNVKPDQQAIEQYQPQWDELVKQHQASLGDGWRTTDTSQAVMAQMDALHQRMVNESIARDPSLLNPGKMYEVNINADPAHFLDWDKPISEQSPEVQAAAAKAWDTGGWEKPLPDDLRSATGEDFHHRLAGKILAETQRGNMPAQSYNSRADAAAALHAAGIPGIRYLDAGSRAQGGTRNTVVFDPATIEILRKYGIAGLIGGGAAAGAATQGQQQ